MAEAFPECDGATREMLRIHALNGAQRAADDASAFAQLARLDYLTVKNQLSFAQATGIRHVEESGAGRARQTTNEAPANR